MIDGTDPGGTGAQGHARASGGWNDVVPLGRYGDFLRRHRLIIGLTVILGVALGVLRVTTTDRTYTSAVVIVVPPVALHADVAAIANTTDTIATGVDERPPRESTVDTEAQLALSDEVLTQLARVPGFRIGRERLKKRISITVPVNTRVLSITVRAYTAKSARNGARALTRSYLALRKRIVSDIQARNQDTLQRSLALLRAQRHAANGQATDIERLTPRGRREKLTQQIAAVQRQLAQATDRSIQSGEVMQSPDVPLHADGSRTDVVLTTWLGLGLLGGLLLGMIQDRRPRRIRSVSDVRRAVSMPVLAEVRSGPDGPRDACRRLRNIIRGEQATAVLLTGISRSSTDQMARTLTAVCAQGGMRSILLRVGADDDIDGEVEVDPVTGTEISASAISSGGDRQLAAAMRWARRDTELVVVTGPAPRSSDAAILATTSDLTFLAVELGGASAAELIACTAYLTDAATPPRGLVVTPAVNPETPAADPEAPSMDPGPASADRDGRSRPDPSADQVQITSLQATGHLSTENPEGTQSGG